jgi:hypothetical protein
MILMTASTVNRQGCQNPFVPRQKYFGQSLLSYLIGKPDEINNRLKSMENPDSIHPYMSITELQYQTGILKAMKMQKVDCVYKVDFSKFEEYEDSIIGLPPPFVCEILRYKKRLTEDFNFLNPL